MTEKTTIDDLIFEIECMAPAGETNGIPYLRLGKADLLHKLNAIKGQSDHQPTFEVGEYYAEEEANFIFKALEINDGTIKVLELDTWFYKLKEGAFNLDSTFAKEAKPATAEQIATFKRAEQFAAKGRKLDEFRVGDKVFHSDGSKGKIVEIRGKELIIIFKYQKYSFREFQYKDFELIQTAEELQGCNHEI
ncbi:hypothetical protein BCR22_07260 [Enterococcus plantarum]|uniref:hypothetical protein n=1 Tax=Enterococcus plantarum TaxID=1077675 RepID=UPI00084D1DE3|nr:hypothetical protein [Enterococcus plantarum]OEG09384.1 hypothetical protein BCR22_07260 [Enterococcus plantarum]